jgi:hypothetical protein
MTRAAVVGIAMVGTAMVAEVQAVFAGGTPAFGGCYGAGVGGWWVVGCRGWEITKYFCVVMEPHGRSACVNNHNHAINHITQGVYHYYAHRLPSVCLAGRGVHRPSKRRGY